MSEFFWSDKPKQTAFPIAGAGYPFIFAAAFVTAVLALLGFTVLTLTALCLTFCICLFFRDPDRAVPKNEGVIVSPADGKVVAAGKIESSPYYEGNCIKISIFMSVFNVHVNRVPYKGKVVKTSYYPGKFFSANLDKASKHNEHNVIYLETENGQKISFVQIAGLVARRIICNVHEGDMVQRGERFGMICFGSRVDIYLPEDSTINVTKGSRVKAGFTVLGFLT